MRNEGTDPTAEDPQPDGGKTYTSAAAGRPRRQKQLIIAGAAGVIAIAGVAAVASQSRRTAPETAPDLAAPAPVTAPALPQPSAVAASSAVAAPSSSAAPSGNASGPAPAAAQSRVPASRGPAAASPSEAPGKASSQGDAAGPPKPAKTLRAVPQNNTVDDSEVDVDETVSDDKRKRLKVVSARADLTGYREMSWVTEESDRVGAVECTSKIRLSPDVPARERPTLLICWRLSATRSVYTVAIDMDGRPVRSESVAALNARWQKAG